MNYEIGDNVSAFFKRQYWNGIIIEKDVIWNNEVRPYVVLVRDHELGHYVETPCIEDGSIIGYLLYLTKKSLK